GPKPIIIIGLALLTAAMIWYSQIPVHGKYASDLLPGYLMVGVGIAFAFVPVSIAALAGVAEREAGLASGLINPSQQVGAARGAVGAGRRAPRVGEPLQGAASGGPLGARRAHARVRLRLLGARLLRRGRDRRGGDADQAGGDGRDAGRCADRLDLRDQRLG